MYTWTPFLSTYSALSRSFEIESREILKISSTFRQLRGGTVKIEPGTEFSRHDWLVQAAYTLAAVRQQCSALQALTIYAFFSAPGNDRVALRKKACCKALSGTVWEILELKPLYLPYVDDVVYEWASKGTRRMTDEGWAARLGKSDRWLRVVKSGDKSRRKIGALTLVNSWFNSGLGSLTDYYSETGVIPHP